MKINEFKIKTHGLCNPKSIVQGEKYRISVLTESLLRLEYSEDGIFEDRATQTVVNRNFPEVSFEVKETEDALYFMFAHNYMTDKDFVLRKVEID